MGWYGQNPIETARAAGQRALDENLAQTRARYAGSGFGNSAREALAEGQAQGDFATKFGDIAAERGLGARESDLNRLATMFATAGEQQLQGKQQELTANQQLANLGTGLTAIGSQEQGIPNFSDAAALIANFGNVQGRNRGAMNPPAK